ncbi:geranyl transferase [Burkholderia sp. Bp9126]|nr:geranyl transferase [Burkholderia sp. Bp9126]
MSDAESVQVPRDAETDQSILFPDPSSNASPRPSIEAEQIEFDVWVRERHRRSELALDRLLPSGDTPQRRLHEAMRYATLGGGKRLRPLLCYAAGVITNAPIDVLDVAASAIEMIHVCSHVHDDLPAMDNDPLRRGRPSVHVQYDEATAILVGDALLSHAFFTLGEATISAEQQMGLTRELAHAIGYDGLAGGQCIDLGSTGLRIGLAELEQMHRMKTGALIRAAVRMGALCGTDEAARPLVLDALDRYADMTGLAFQVVDDILDAESDALANRTTYVSILGLEASRTLVAELRHRATIALEPLGSSATYLRFLISSVADCVQQIN